MSLPMSGKDGWEEPWGEKQTNKQNKTKKNNNKKTDN